MATTGPKAPRGEVADRILQTARVAFARDGFAGTTMQGIARESGVDTKLVRYYFGSKEALLVACLATPMGLLERIGPTASLPLEQRGEAIVRAMCEGWADPDLALVLRTSLLIGAHEEIAMARVRAIFVDSLIPALGLDPDLPESSVRGGLISAQLLGLAFARFVYKIDQTTAISTEAIVRHVGETIQRYLTGPVDMGV